MLGRTFWEKERILTITIKTKENGVPEGIGSVMDLLRIALEAVAINRRFLASFERGIRKLILLCGWYTRKPNSTSKAWRRENFPDRGSVAPDEFSATLVAIFQTQGRWIGMS